VVLLLPLGVFFEALLFGDIQSGTHASADLDAQEFLQLATLE
jgi:hypothetical protein